MSIQPRDVTPEIAAALAALRIFAADESRNSLNTVSREAALAMNVLDNVGVFATIDEVNDYASAEEILAESALNACLCGGSFDGRRFGIGCTEQKPDPAEWGDTTREDMAQHQIGLPVLASGEEIRPVFSDTHPRAARELGELIAGRIGAALQDDEDNPPVVDPDALTMHDPAVCPSPRYASPAQHSGICPVWQAHHTL